MTLYSIETLWWHISAINCQIIMSNISVDLSVIYVDLSDRCNADLSDHDVDLSDNCYLYGINWARTRKISSHSLADLEGAWGRTPSPPPHS